MKNKKAMEKSAMAWMIILLALLIIVLLLYTGWWKVLLSGFDAIKNLIRIGP